MARDSREVRVPHVWDPHPCLEGASWLAVTSIEHQEHRTNDRGDKRRKLLSPSWSPQYGSSHLSSSSRQPSPSTSCADWAASSSPNIEHNDQELTTWHTPGTTPQRDQAHHAQNALEQSQLIASWKNQGSTSFQRQQETNPDQRCFGMLSFKFKSQERISTPSAPSRVVLRGSSIISEHNQTIKFGAVHSSARNVLEQLLSHEGIDLQLLVARTSQRLNANELLVILYGQPDYADDIADFLDDCQLFLQDPKFCDRDVPYENPQAFQQKQAMTLAPRVRVQTEVRASNEIVDLLTDLESGQTLVETPTPSSLKTQLLSHQKQALTFMLLRESPRPRASYDLWAVVEGQELFRNTISEEVVLIEPPDFCGGILADQMGLGKSLSAIALVASDLDHGSTEPTLIVVRAALLETWTHELETHLHPESLRFKLHHDRSRLVSYNDLQSVNVVLSTYHTLMAEYKKHQSQPQLMFRKKWRRVVLDEAHDIRDDKSMIAKAIYALESQSRWALTGTPLQNRLTDMASLFKFVQIHPYDNPRNFKWQISVLTSKYGIDRARQLLKLVMLRRSISSVKLPPRKDFDVSLQFSADEQQLYDRAKLRTRDALGAGATQHVFSLIHKLLMICNLGVKVKLSDDGGNEEWSAATAQAILNELATAGEALCHSCAADVFSSVTEAADTLSGRDNRPYLSQCRALTCGSCWQRGMGCGHNPACRATAVSTMGSILKTEQDALLSNVREPSTKVAALVQDLMEHQSEEKSAVFSFWMTTLDVIEFELERHGMPCIRIDGTVSQKVRDKRLKAFREDNGVRVVLITISCGSVGLNLTVASRAYLMEPHWNPSIEQQALARVYRMGQTRPVTTIRYIMRGSFEEHVLNVQRRKKELSELLMPQDGAGGSVSRLHGMEQYL